MIVVLVILSVKRSCYNASLNVEKLTSLSPFHEVINSHYNMMVPPSRRWVAIHKIEPPLSEGTGGDNGMQWGRF